MYSITFSSLLLASTFIGVPFAELDLLNPRTSVVLNATVPQEDITNLSTYKLQRIFKLEDTMWSNGTKITVVLPPADTVSYRRLVQSLLFTNTNSYTMHIASKYQNSDNRAIQVDTEDQVIVKVAVTPNSIGYSVKAIPEHKRFGVIPLAMSMYLNP